jgi:hypothetical protein
VQSMYDYQDRQSERWKRDLSLISTAIATEAFICGYLRRLAYADDIQPGNAQVSRVHLHDELTHRGIFRAVAHWIFNSLSSTSEQGFFVSSLEQSSRWLSFQEVQAWNSALEQISFPAHSELVNDCIGLESDGHQVMEPIKDLLRELGHYH